MIRVGDRVRVARPDGSSEAHGLAGKTGVVIRSVVGDLGVVRVRIDGKADPDNADADGGWPLCVEELDVIREPQPVDVLAAMDEAIADGFIVRDRADNRAMREARAAVAELIAAVRDHLESMDSYPTDLVPMNRRSGTTKPLRAALARVGGGK